MPDVAALACHADDAVACQLELDEDDRLTVYDDATGKPIVAGVRVIGNPTIGAGVLLSAPGGITEAESRMLLSNRLQRARTLAARIPVYAVLDTVRQDVLVQMVYQMGVRGVLGFRKALAFMAMGEWKQAADALLDSAWHRQTPARAERLAKIIETGEAP